jgi:hypothetical protein
MPKKTTKKKTCKFCGNSLPWDEDHSWWDENSDQGLHGGHCYHRYFEQFPPHMDLDNHHFIQFNEEGRPLEPVTRRDALKEVKRLQNLCYNMISDLEKFDKPKAKRLKHELES